MLLQFYRKMAPYSQSYADEALGGVIDETPET